MDNRKNLRCWAEINLGAIRHNVGKLKEQLPDNCALMAVVKGEAYGHGMIPAAMACAEVGVEWFGVATIDEALYLRENGLFHPILIFGVTPPERAVELSENRLSQIVPSLEYAKALCEYADVADPLSIHIAVDTGMGRLGWWLEEKTMQHVCDEVCQINAMPQLYIEGLMTQLAWGRGNTQEALDFSHRQFELFDVLSDELKKHSINPTYRHALNSGGIMNHARRAMDMVRVGHLLFDSLPGAEHIGLCPALEMKTTIAFIKELPAGASVGYGCSYRLVKSARIAVLNVGYSDGYPECFSNKGKMLLHGKIIPVVGCVCMDQTMVDVTDVPEAKVGDVVTIVGRDGNLGLTMKDVADQVGGVLNDPISVNITNRMPRFFKK